MNYITKRRLNWIHAAERLHLRQRRSTGHYYIYNPSRNLRYQLLPRYLVSAMVHDGVLEVGEPVEDNGNYSYVRLTEYGEQLIRIHEGAE